jgi:hypothetical protein
MLYDFLNGYPQNPISRAWGDRDRNARPLRMMATVSACRRCCVTSRAPTARADHQSAGGSGLRPHHVTPSSRRQTRDNITIDIRAKNFPASTRSRFLRCVQPDQQPVRDHRSRDWLAARQPLKPTAILAPPRRLGFSLSSGSGLLWESVRGRGSLRPFLVRTARCEKPGRGPARMPISTATNFVPAPLDQQCGERLNELRSRPESGSAATAGGTAAGY